MTSIYERLQAVQQQLKAPKGQRNTFAGFNYRSAEDILEAVKPLLASDGLVLTLSDSIVTEGGRCYVKATARAIDVATGEFVENAALAREPQEKRGMDEPQVTGTCSSYARKYAMNGLFAIDDAKDPDTDEYQKQAAAAKKAGGRRKKAANEAGAAVATNATEGTEGTGAATPANAADTTNVSGTDADKPSRPALIHTIAEMMKNLGLTKERVSALAQEKYGKASTRTMTDEELQDLAAHLVDDLAEEAF